MTFRFIDLFAGIGGIRLALESAGGKCVFSSEIDERAAETYFDNFGETPAGDITAFTKSHLSDEAIDLAIPDHDVLAAGFPCQPFSSAGVSARNFLGQEHGLLDKSKGTLFFDICRIAKAKQPKALLLENVSNIVNHEGGRTFGVIREAVEEGLGYQFFFKVLSSETLVPQRRKRCFMVAFRDPVDAFEFPEFKGDPIPLRTALEDGVDRKYTISDKAWDGHVRRTKHNLERGTGFTAHEADLDRPANTLVARYYKDGKECLIPQEGKNPRLLTPRECARLQGFPDSFKVHPSRSAAYKQFGNSVPVPVVREVANALKVALEKSENGRSADAGKAIGKYVGHKRKEHKTGAVGQKSAA